MKLNDLRGAFPNAVVWSDAAWAVARKGSGGGTDAYWFADQGATTRRSYTAEELLGWVDDWVFLRNEAPRD